LFCTQEFQFVFWCYWIIFVRVKPWLNLWKILEFDSILDFFFFFDIFAGIALKCGFLYCGKELQFLLAFWCDWFILKSTGVLCHAGVALVTFRIILINFSMKGEEGPKLWKGHYRWNHYIIIHSNFSNAPNWVQCCTKVNNESSNHNFMARNRLRWAKIHAGAVGIRKIMWILP
jgi:hypothetical protein